MAKKKKALKATAVKAKGLKTASLKRLPLIKNDNLSIKKDFNGLSNSSMFKSMTS